MDKYLYIVVKKYESDDGDDTFEFREWGEDDESIAFVDEQEAIKYADELTAKALDGIEYTVKTVDIVEEPDSWDV